MSSDQIQIESDDVTIAVTDRGGAGPTVVLLHGLAGSSRELLPTADALTDAFRVLLVDQRGHGQSTRLPADVSRAAYVRDVVEVVERLAPGERVALVGQSMGAHTALLTAASRPDLVERLVLLEGHAAGGGTPESAAQIGRYFASWPVPFADEATARAFLPDEPITEAWIADLEQTADGLRPRFDAGVMEQTIAAVHEPRWPEWEALEMPVLAVFGDRGLFTEDQKVELMLRARNGRRADLAESGHDAHLEAFDAWITALRDFLLTEENRGA